MNTRNILIIGAGQNSLVAAFYLARAGLKPLVLERRSAVGGATSTLEFHPGFRASVLDAPGPLAPGIARDMRLQPLARQSSDAARLFAPLPDALSLLLYADAARSAKNIEAFSKSDAASYLDLAQIFESASGLIRDLLLMTPPDVDTLTSSAIWDLLRTGKTFRGLGKKNMRRLLRWGPMAVADFAAEFFETELLRAVIAAPGISGTAAGPWSAGTAALLLLRLGAGGLPDGKPSAVSGLSAVAGSFAQAGALSEALAAAAIRAGAEIRTNAEVARILVKNDAVAGVLLKNGEEIAASAVVSGADPKRTFLQLLEPVHLAPSFLVKMQHYRAQGTVARVFLALDALPNFTALKNSSPAEAVAALSGRIHIGPEIDYLERAFDASKYGNFSAAPYLDASIPSLLDPSLVQASSPAEAASPAKARHVMAISMQYAPYKVKPPSTASREASPNCHSEPGRPRLANGGEEPAFGSAASPKNWPALRDALADAVIKTLAEYAPDLPSKILARRVITPLDLEIDYGLTGGHISHGELALDQLFTMRPLLGFARYRTPIRNLFLCGSGTHPGVALAAASALNSSREILRALRRQPRP
ncbi:MAG TPA: NAD(P)/FAD-dependent oxidoreductase [Candidatus Acidoferrales bacterium]|nr:NAD(P)/FAD-dependent oxidoreductase [Candidatus Acidoferrales bacterium]